MNPSMSVLAVNKQLLTMATLLLSGQLVEASPAIALNKEVTPPSTIISVTGSGFTAAEKISIYFDTTDEGSITANSSGSFNIFLKVPKTALPGTHRIKAYRADSRTYAQQPLLIRTDWAQLGFSSTHQAQNPYENVLKVTNAGTLDTAWTFDTDFYLADRSSPVVANGLAYIAGGSHLDAIDATTGTLKWKTIMNGRIYGGFSDIAVDGNTAYVTSSDIDISNPNDQIHAKDTATGILKWTHTLDGRASSPLTVAGGIIYVTTQHWKVQALDAATGNVKWSYALQGTAWSSPAVSGGLVYVGAEQTLYALNAATGAHVWHYNSGENLLSSAAVYGGLVYAWFGGNLYALDAANGAFKWIHWTNYKNDYYPPIVANGTIIAMGHGTIDALNSADGSLKWHYDIPGVWNKPNDSNTAAAANGVLYVLAENVTWTSPDPYHAPTSICDKTLYTVDIANGGLLGSHYIGSIDNCFESMPVIANGTVYLMAGSTLQALTPAQ